LSDGGGYDVLIGNSQGVVISQSAALTVQPVGTGPGSSPTATPELGSGELLVTGFLPLGLALVIRRRRGARGKEH